MTVCLDAWAVIEWLKGSEPAASLVETAMAGDVVMSWINVGEVSSVLQRADGAKESIRVLRQLRHRAVLELPTEERVIAAATIKSRHRLSDADAFAVATAVAHRATLYTGDPEIINGDPEWDVTDIRRS